MRCEEWFPISSWALFNVVPNECNDVAIRVLEIDNEALRPGLMFEQCRDCFPEAKAIEVRRLAQQIASAVRRGDVEGAAHMRDLLEHLHLMKGHWRVHYE